MRRQLSRVIPLNLIFAMALGYAPSSRANQPEVFNLSLEDVLNAEITSVSRKSQRLADSAAAVSVLSNEDIQRSGATSVPEALRMVPGLDVARLGSNRWAVSSRGFNGRFANKLLVLVDGRSIYSKLFSGVFWEAEDVMLEDVDRIEVIRGPGAALWGANAVNGVINIITKKAKATQGTLLAAHAGSEERGGLVARHGGQSDADTYYRVWGKVSRTDASVDNAGQRTNDDGRSARAGFRMDKETGGGSRFSMIGNAYDVDAGETLLEASLFAPYFNPVEFQQKNSGANLLGRHEWLLADGSQAQLQAYIDHAVLRANSVVNEKHTTVDIDFQHRVQAGSRQDLVWGLGYRWAEDGIDTDWVLLKIDPKAQSSQLVSAFVHDEITLVPERWKLMLGSKFEHNSYTGFEIQPNARLLWTPTPVDTLWASVSRAVRTPSRGERDSQINPQVTAPFSGLNSSPLPVWLQIMPNPNLDSEKLVAYEVGYRTQVNPLLSFDATAFYNSYEELRSITSLAMAFDPFPVPHVVNQVVTGNKLTATTHGVELAVDWHVANWWRLQGAYTYFDMKTERTGDIAGDAQALRFEDTNPRNQFSLRSAMNLNANRQFDIWVRYVSSLPGYDIPAYTAVDMRYAWKVRKDLELSLVGQNLFDPRHAEFVSDNMLTRNVELQRGAYVKAKWQF